MSGNDLQNIGLCKKAGKLIWGFDAVTQELKGAGKNAVAGILLCRDVSPKTRKEINYHALKSGCPVTELDSDMSEVEKIIKKRAGILGVSDKGLFGLFGKSNNFKLSK